MPESSPTLPVPIDDRSNGKHKNIPIEQILEYHQAGLTTRDIGKLCGCSHSNIAQRLRDYRTDIKGLKIYKDKRADVMALVGKRMLYSLTDKDIKAMPGGSRVLAYCQLYDKERTERGKPGQYVEYTDMTAALDDVNSEVADLERQLAELDGVT